MTTAPRSLAVSMLALGLTEQYWKLIIHTQPSKDKYLQIVEYQSGIVTPQAFANIELVIDNLLLY